jgi:hypothetical protein
LNVFRASFAGALASKIIAALAAAAALAIGLAHAEIGDRGPRSGGLARHVVLDLLGAERTSFAALIVGDELTGAEMASRRAIRVKPAPGIDDGRSRAELDLLTGEDADTAAAISEARSRILPDMMATDFEGAIDLSEILNVEVGKPDPQWRCLTEALYFEARGESLVGQVAVAEVILNRVDSKAFPSTVCGVVRQGAGKLNSCQFSFYCDGKAENIANSEKFEEMGKIAWVMLQGKPRILTGNATHYHTAKVSPRWAKRLVRTARIGAHIFYRPSMQLSER